MDLGLKGKKAIVLGGSRGIGFYTSSLLVQEGADVALCARGADGVRDAAIKIQAVRPGVKVHAEPADLGDAESTRAFVRGAIAALGGLDILIHNASGFGSDNSEAAWARSFQVDVMAGVRAVDEALPALKASGSASIIFVGSMASKYYFGRPPSAYGAAKAAMRTYANELAQAHGKDGIRANVISPGAVWFPDGSWDKQKQNNPKFYAAVERAIPLGRLGSGEEIARVIVFTASPAGLWINSTHLAADGGQVAAVD
ncbi:MAG: SDR family oxidoreductase [Gammaproteobacteria bacterium]|nr:SDR family oxidoreductase [Gammaproteobacteria bacterium]